MQKGATIEEKSLWKMSPRKALAAIDEELSVERANLESPSSSGALGRFFHKLDHSIRVETQYYSRLLGEIKDYCKLKWDQIFPHWDTEVRFLELRRDADLANRLNETNLVMIASNTEMFFYGHPFRGAAMLAPLAPFLLGHAFVLSQALSFGELDKTIGSFVPVVYWLYVYGYWHLFARKLVRAVWYDPEKDLFSIFMPYRFTMPLTFKPGHVMEIDSLLANLDIRGTKAFCPRGLFFDGADYDKMFKNGKRRLEKLHSDDFI